jgi:xanthine/uracil permease
MKRAGEIVKEQVLAIIGIILGAIGGYLYWHYIGCVSGTCPITSSPIMSTIWGALLGGLLLSMFKKDKKESK